MTLNDRLAIWLKGNVEAVSLILSIHEIYELWDDIVDGDATTEQRINTAFFKAMVEVPRNGFYRQHFHLLSPIVELSIIDWWSANQLERAKDKEKLRHAWGLRFSPLAITAMCARIIGGAEWAAQVNAEFRSLGEPWETYAKEHGGLDGLA